MGNLNIFNTVRNSVYGSVLVFTIICLGMAGHFSKVLASSDLTRFVPVAIFVCSITLFIILILLASSFFLKERNPIATKYELPSIGIVGLLWLVLGCFLATAPSQSADVECFASATDTTPLDDSVSSFHTEQFHAMYRVLNAFALMNATLILLASLALFFLAWRRHRMGDTHMWRGPVTSCAWFKDYAGKNRKGVTKQPSLLPTTYSREPTRRHQSQRSQRSRNLPPEVSEKPYPVPEKAYQPRQAQHHRQNSANSKTSMLSGNSETRRLEVGMMHNPNKEKRNARR